MPTVSDELISKLSMDDSQFQARGKAVIQTAQSIAKALNQMTASLQSANQAMGGVNFGSSNQFNFIGGGSGGSSRGGFGGSIAGAMLLVRAIRMVESAIIDAGKEFVRFSGDALKEFASFDTLQKSFEGIYGSVAKASQMMTYLRDTAMTSAFHFRDLADAARGLAVSGLDVNRFLPIVQGFALAMGHIDSAGLEDFVSILRRIEGGNTGFALGPRGIGRYGVSRAEMEKYGAQFGGANGSHFEGSTKDALDIIEKIFKARIEKIAQSVTASTEVVMSNWTDAIQQATIDAGAGIAQNLVGPIKQITGAMNSLRQSGFFKDLFGTVFSIIGIQGLLGKAGLAKTDFKKDFHGSMSEMDAYERQHFQERREGRLGLLMPNTSGDRIQDVLIDIGGHIVYMAAYAKGSFEMLGNVWEAIKLLNPLVAFLSKNGVKGSVADQAAEQMAGFEANARYRNVTDWRDKVLHPDRHNAPDTPNISGLDDEEGQTGLLGQIAEHTKKIHEGLQRYAFGGNDLGRIGVTAQELGSHSGSESMIRQAVTLIKGAVQLEMFEHTAHRARMSGY